MCGEDGADETYCLDGCSGYEGTLEGVDEFKYRYYSVRLVCLLLISAPKAAKHGEFAADETSHIL